MIKKTFTTCKIHGKTKGYTNGNRLRCSVCNIMSVTKRRKKIKSLAIEYKGGKCEKCNYNKCVDALDFHHKFDEKKEFGIGQCGHSRSWSKVKVELDKCLLLCSNCHREEHAKLNSNKQHGYT